MQKFSGFQLYHSLHANNPNVEHVCQITQYQQAVLSLDHVFPSKSRYDLSLPPGTDITEFREAWDRVKAILPILRTGFVMSEEHVLALTYKHDSEKQAKWVSSNTDTYTEPFATNLDVFDGEVPIAVHTFGTFGSGYNVQMYIHPALCDVAGARFLIQLLHSMYFEQSAPVVVSNFQELAMDIDPSAAICRVSDIDFIWSPAKSHSGIGSASAMTISRASCTEFCKATASFRGALAATMALHSGIHTHLFIETTSRRPSLSPALQTVVGPCLASTFVRLSVDASRSPSEVLPSSVESFVLSTSEEMRPFASCIHLKILSAFDHINNANIPGWRIEDARFGMLSPFSVDVSPSQEGLTNIQITYDHACLRDSIDVDAFANHFASAIDILSSCPASSLSDSFRTISDIRHDRIIPLGINQTSRELGQTDPYNLLAHERFDIHAKSTPSAIALDYEGSSFMTYSELAAHSDALAAELSAKGVTSDVMVPILFDVSFDMVVAILAIMKAGGAYVPLVPDHPQARWERILDLTTARLLVCDTGIARQTVIGDIRKSFPELTVLPYSHDTFTSSSTASNFIPNAKENNLAYVFFTSGSTGVPKGVAVEHRNLRAFLNTGKGNAMTMPGMRKLLFASYGFDISVGDIFSALTSGGTLGLVKRESLFSDIPHWLDVMKPTHIGVTPSIARYIPTEGLPHLRYVLLNGETLPVYLALRLSRTREVHNIMGPTEATIDATELIIPTSDESSFRERVPIGYPIGENTIYILRPGTLELAAQGEVGEICIGGPQVARGYIGDPELSNSKFVPDPFHEDPGMMFRSADLGRWNHLGQLDHLGRMDGQVKLRGLRIETGEIEYVVQKSNPDLHVVHADVVQHRDEQVMVAVFILKGMTGAEWVVPSSNEAVSRAIKFASSACDMYLPRYMKPAVWLSVTDFPTTTSRKIDRSTLRAKIQNHLSTISTTPRESIRHATTSIETLVVSIASEVLAIPSENIDLNASLVALGSSSIQAMGLTAKLREGGLDATILGLLDERVTLADLAALPTSNTAQVNGAQEHVIYAPFALAPSGWQNAAQRLNINIEDVEDVYPVDVIAQDWVQLALNHGGRGLLTQYKYDLSGDLDADRFAWSWEQLVLREPSLRTVFINVDLDFEQAKKVENGITYAESAGLNAAVLRSNVRGRGPFFDMVIAQDAGEANALISKMFGEHGLELGVVPIRNLLVYNERDFTWLFASSRHHALHDFRSLTMQSEELSDLYHKGEAAFPAIEGRRSIEKSFGAFMQVAHAYERRAAGRVFWREYLADVGLPVWPPISQVPLTFYKDFNTYGIHVSMWNGNMASIAKKLHVTKGALARTAYAIALSEKERREKVAMYEIVDGLGGTGMNPWGFGTHYQYTKVNTSPASDDMSELDRFIKVARDCHQGFVETLPHRASGCDMAAEIVGASSERGQHFASALLNIFDLTTSQTPVEPTKEVQTFSLLQRFATTEQGSFVGVNFPLNVGIRILDHVTILACPYDLSMISKEEMDTFVQRHVGVLDKLSEVLG